MKINRYGKAEVLTPDQINLLFTEGLVKPRDKALFGVCLYAACRINSAKLSQFVVIPILCKDALNKLS